MKGVKNILVFILTLLSFDALHGQDPLQQIWNQVDSMNLEIQQNAAPAKFSPWSLNTTLGTSFGYSPVAGSYMNFSAAPHANYAATDRLTFHAGIMASHIRILTGTGNSEFEYPNGFSSMSAFVAASYRLSSNLVIHGAGVRQLLGPPGIENSSRLNFSDLSVGASYHIGNFSIGATFHKSDLMPMAPPFGYGNSFYGSPIAW